MTSAKNRNSLSYTPDTISPAREGSAYQVVLERMCVIRTLPTLPLSAAPCARIYGVSTSRRRGVIVQFRKWGNSLAVRIPKSVADALAQATVSVSS
jgi:hypothetical protein